MISRIKALRSLCWNYRRRGVWAWLKGASCWGCGGNGAVVQATMHFGPGEQPPRTENLASCTRCHGKPKRGYQRILTEPQRVLSEQTAIAEGVMG